MVCGGVEEGAFDIATPLIVIADEREIDGAPLVHRRISTALGDPRTVGVVGHLLADRRPMILAVGLLDVCQALGPFAGQMHPAPEPVAGRPHGGRIDIGLREPTTAQQRRNFLCIDRVVFGLAPMDGLQVEGMTPHEGHPLLSTEISPPVPGDETFATDDDILAIGRDGREKRVWGCWHVTGHQHLPSLVHDAEGQRAGVQIDATGKLVRLGVESPEVSSSS
jgi:hypothetical protein